MGYLHSTRDYYRQVYRQAWHGCLSENWQLIQLSLGYHHITGIYHCHDGLSSTVGSCPVGRMGNFHFFVEFPFDMDNISCSLGVKYYDGGRIGRLEITSPCRPILLYFQCIIGFTVHACLEWDRI